MKTIKYFLTSLIISITFLSTSQIYTKYPLTIAVSQTDPSCNGLNDGQITIDISGGVAPYIINGLTINTSSFTMANLSGGSYNFLIYDSGNGAAGGFITLTDPVAPSISVIVNNETNSQSNGSIELMVSPTPGSYQWISFTSTVLTNPIAEDQYNLSAGIYGVTIIDANGCQYDKRFTVQQSLAPVINGNFVNPGSNNNPSAMNVYGTMGELVNYETAPSGMYLIPDGNGGTKKVYKN